MPDACMGLAVESILLNSGAALSLLVNKDTLTKQDIPGSQTLRAKSNPLFRQAVSLPHNRMWTFQFWRRVKGTSSMFVMQRQRWSWGGEAVGRGGAGDYHWRESP